LIDAEIDRFRALTIEMLEKSDDLWRDAVGKMLSDSSAGQENETEQPIFVSDLLAGDWICHPETRLLFHRSNDSIQLYYNGLVHELPNQADVLDHLQQLCDLREWPAEPGQRKLSAAAR